MFAAGDLWQDAKISVAIQRAALSALYEIAMHYQVTASRSVHPATATLITLWLRLTQAACFSLSTDRALDSVHALTMACLLVVFDATIRVLGAALCLPIVKHC